MLAFLLLILNSHTTWATESAPKVAIASAEVAELNEADLQPQASAYLSQCLPEYLKRKHHIVRDLLLDFPEAAASEVVGFEGGGYAGLALGKLFTGGSAWGSIIGSGYGVIFGVMGPFFFFVGREGFLVEQLIVNAKMIHLLRELETQPGKYFAKIHDDLAAQGSTWSESQILAQVQELDRSHALCNGTLSGHPTSTILRRRLADLRQVRKELEKLAKESP